MSAPNLQVVLSQKARRDFVDILRYTAEQLGTTQLEIFGVHLIVYRKQANRIRILRILHQRMDPANRY